MLWPSPWTGCRAIAQRGLTLNLTARIDLHIIYRCARREPSLPGVFFSGIPGAPADRRGTRPAAAAGWLAAHLEDAMPRKPCSIPGCRALVIVGVPRCARHQAQFDQERVASTDLARSDASWRKWYKTAAWRARRAQQLSAEPLCHLCPPWSRQSATVADHVTPHRGDHALFWFGPLQSLCKSCHDTKKQRIERRAVPDRAAGGDPTGGVESLGPRA